MVEARSLFGLSVAADELIATGGYNNNEGQGISSVEVFTFQDGWIRELRLDMT